MIVGLPATECNLSKFRLLYQFHIFVMQEDFVQANKNLVCNFTGRINNENFVATYNAAINAVVLVQKIVLLYSSFVCTTQQLKFIQFSLPIYVYKFVYCPAVLHEIVAKYHENTISPLLFQFFIKRHKTQKCIYSFCWSKVH